MVKMLRFPLLLSVTVLLNVGCAPAYDSVADQLQVSVEKKIDEGLLRLESDARVITVVNRTSALASSKQAQDARTDSSFSANIKFYADVQSDLATLESRLEANGASGQKVAVDVASIAQNVQAISDLQQKENTLSASYLSGVRTSIGQQFKALDVYQVQLKSGGKAP